jgi:hypothetical protein
MATSIDTDLAGRYADLIAEKRGIDRRKREIEKELRTLEEPLRMSFIEAGAANLALERDGNRTTLYLHRQVWASPAEGKDRKDVAAALVSIGMGELVNPNYNSNTLSAWVRERVKAEEAIPEGLVDVLNITERIEVNARITER